MTNPGFEIYQPAVERTLELTKQRYMVDQAFSKALLATVTAEGSVLPHMIDMMLVRLNAFIYESQVDQWTYSHPVTLTEVVDLTDEEIRASAGFWRFLPMSVLRKMKPTTRTFTETRIKTVDFTAHVRFPDFIPSQYRTVLYVRQQVRDE